MVNSAFKLKNIRLKIITSKQDAQKNFDYLTDKVFKHQVLEPGIHWFIPFDSTFWSWVYLTVYESSQLKQCGR